MSVGQGSVLGALSYLAVGRETTFGTYTTCTAGLDFLSSSLKTLKENKILESIERSRTYSKRIHMGKKTEGEVEFYVFPLYTATGYILQNAFGGTVTSATATGETAGGGAFTHTFNIGAMDQSYTSLCVNLRKGETSSGKIFEYSGVRINEISFTSELDEALKCSMGLVCKDSSQTSNTVDGALTFTAASPLSFENGRISVESSFASLTSTSFWHVQSCEFTLNNSIKSENEARRIGSDVPAILPVGVMSFTLNMTVRFDTTTAYSAMLNATQLYAELEFLGPTMSGSAVRQGLKFQFQKLIVTDAGDPEIGGPDEILTSEIVFHVLRDDSSATGYACRALLTNNISSLA